MLLPGERIDDLERNGLVIIQNPERFSFGMDAVLLSAYVRAPRGSRILDLGTGTGILPILLSDRTEAAEICGLEIMEDIAGMAERSVSLNHLGDRVKITCGDLRRAEDYFEAASFDVITSNPPYIPAGSGLLTGGASGDEEARSHDAARHEICCTFEDVAAAAAKLLKSNGHFFLVHRPARLVEIVGVLSGRGLEPKRMRFVHPYADRRPGLVLLDCVRGARSGVTVEEPLVVYESPGRYTPETGRIYGRE